MRRNKGVILIVVFFVVVIFLILLASFVFRGVQEKDLTQRQKENYEAFNLAEAGLDRAIVELRANFNWAGVSNISLGRGVYSVIVTSVSSDERKLDCYGYIPLAASARQSVHIEAQIRKSIPGGFYSNAVYSAGDVDFNGNSFSVVNNEAPPDNTAVLYADEFDVQKPQNIIGASTQDPSISPLARLDFSQLHTISAGQGNVYNATRLQDIQRGRDSFPSSFWYDAPTNTVPNVVYVEEDLQLNGNIGTIGGFLVVAGDVLTDPSGGASATINGNGQINGCVYTLGEFQINGGGGNLNINGGVWAADEVGLNGNAAIQYNATYMNAISSLHINPDVQVVSWRQI